LFQRFIHSDLNTLGGLAGGVVCRNSSARTSKEIEQARQALDLTLSCASRRKTVKSYRKELWFETPGRRAFLNITPQVEAALKESGVREGLALVNAMHITASVFINDDETGLHADYDAWLERLAPHEPVSGYRHNRTGEDNADAHMKRQVMGREVVVAITAGKLDFGPWEQIFYGEFDGGRRKRVLIKIIGE
jgi:secondary thiamine-phosphate synthase enzyme